LEALKAQYETLKIASSLLGSDENKRDTKLKINSLIVKLITVLHSYQISKNMEKLKIKISIADRCTL
jgi:hypothetical protein